MTHAPSAESSSGGPLVGCTVVDLSMFVAGPMTTLILGEQGADVIKVEPPGGDPFRAAGTTKHGTGAWWMSTNRCKRSVVIDLRTPDGQDLVRSLAEKADVLLHGFRSGVAERFGIDWETLHAVNPRLVYATISGFGGAGPLANQRVYDNIIQAYVGLNRVQAGEGEPASVRTPIADKLAPLMLAQAITAALYERERSGAGQLVDASMLHTALWWMWPDMMMHDSFVGDEGVETGEGPREYRNLVFATNDGYITAVTSTDAEWRAFTAAVDRQDWLEHPQLGDPAWRNRHRNEVFDAMATEIGKYPTDVLLARLAAADAPAGPVNEPAAVLEEPQVVANGIVTTLEHPEVGALRQPTPPVRFSGTTTTPFAAPVLGQHTRDVLRNLGLTDVKIAELQRDRVVATDDDPIASRTS